MKHLIAFKILILLNRLHAKWEEFLSKHVGYCEECHGSGIAGSRGNPFTSCRSCGGDGLSWSEGDYYANELHTMYTDL